MCLKYFALSILVVSLIMPPQEAVAQRGGARGGGAGARGGGAGARGGARGGGGGQRNSGGGFGGGLSRGNSPSGMQHQSASMGPYGGGGRSRSQMAGQPSMRAGARPGAGSAGPAAGAAAANRNTPNATGKQGAAAGAAVANRNAPNATGKQGAAAGAAVANRNAPNATGKQGAAAGAAFANRNAPNATGAQGAAAGAAFANRNAPQYTGAEGAALGAAAASRPGGANGYAGAYGTHYASAAALESQAAAVRAAAIRSPVYNTASFAAYRNAWQPTNVVTASLYQHPGYAALAAGLGLSSQPVPYDYGGNVVVQPTAVYVNGEAGAAPEQYSDQASQIANAGQSAEPAPSSKWLPLGVFALLEGDATTSDDHFQLAVNPEGILRGNYHNLRNDQVEEVMGSVDKSTQRAAWTIGDDQSPVYEAGIANLTKDETPILVHLANGESRQMTLIRLEQPAQ